MDEELLGLRMVKDRVLTEAQLSTATDFQKAVGGGLKDVILRLKLVDENVLSSYFAGVGGEGESSPPEPEPTPPPPRRERHQDKTVPLPPLPGYSVGAEDASVEPADAGGNARSLHDFAETAIVTEALIRILVRKGVISKGELKSEVLQADPDSLVRNGVIDGE